MPILRSFTDNMLNFIQQVRQLGWDHQVPIPQDLKQEVRDLNVITLGWQGRPFLEKVYKTHLHSDSSQVAWAGVNIQTGQKVQEFWREQKTLHINLKELQAAVHTVKSLSRPKDTVILSVDNSVTHAYLHKGGGRKAYLNQILRPLWLWCMEHNIHLKVQLVRSEEDLADKWIRTDQDHGDYTLDMDRGLFLQIQKNFSPHCQPKIDMFASPGNTQLKLFIARYPHWQALDTDSLRCSLEKVGDCFANPPWKVISPWLRRLKMHPQVRCLVVLPLWVGALWWPLLAKLHVPGTPVLQIPPVQGLFQNCCEELMPKPRLPLVCLLLSRGCWNPRSFRLRPSI
jgi:hypothetical protein